MGGSGTLSPAKKSIGVEVALYPLLWEDGILLPFGGRVPPPLILKRLLQHQIIRGEQLQTLKISLGTTKAKGLRGRFLSVSNKPTPGA